MDDFEYEKRPSGKFGSLKSLDALDIYGSPLWKDPVEFARYKITKYFGQDKTNNILFAKEIAQTAKELCTENFAELIPILYDLVIDN